MDDWSRGSDFYVLEILRYKLASRRKLWLKPEPSFDSRDSVYCSKASQPFLHQLPPESSP